MTCVDDGWHVARRGHRQAPRAVRVEAGADSVARSAPQTGQIRRQEVTETSTTPGSSQEASHHLATAMFRLYSQRRVPYPISTINTWEAMRNFWILDMGCRIWDTGYGLWIRSKEPKI